MSESSSPYWLIMKNNISTSYYNRQLTVSIEYNDIVTDDFLEYFKISFPKYYDQAYKLIFNNCSQLEYVDLSWFDTCTNVQVIEFQNCDKLSTIDTTNITPFVDDDVFHEMHEVYYGNDNSGKGIYDDDDIEVNPHFRHLGLINNLNLRHVTVNLNLRELYIENCPISSVINLDNCYLKNIYLKNTDFRHLKLTRFIRTVDIDNCPMSDLKIDVGISLVRFIMKNTNIRHLPAFRQYDDDNMNMYENRNRILNNVELHNLKNLMTIHTSYFYTNRFKMVNCPNIMLEDLYYTPYQMGYIIISDCNLTSIPKFMFNEDEKSRISSLVYSHNNLQSLNSEDFTNTNSIVLDFSYNCFKNCEYFKNIRCNRLNLEYNLLETFVTRVYTDDLNISNNRLKFVDFSKYQNINVNARNNYIEFYKNAERTTNLDLRFNNISFYYDPQDSNCELDYNPLNEDYKNYQTYLKYKDTIKKYFNIEYDEQSWYQYVRNITNISYENTLNYTIDNFGFDYTDPGFYMNKVYDNDELLGISSIDETLDFMARNNFQECRQRSYNSVMPLVSDLKLLNRFDLENALNSYTNLEINREYGPIVYSSLEELFDNLYDRINASLQTLLLGYKNNSIYSEPHFCGKIDDILLQINNITFNLTDLVRYSSINKLTDTLYITNPLSDHDHYDDYLNLSQIRQLYKILTAFNDKVKPAYNFDINVQRDFYNMMDKYLKNFAINDFLDRQRDLYDQLSDNDRKAVKLFFWEFFVYGLFARHWKGWLYNYPLAYNDNDVCENQQRFVNFRVNQDIILDLYDKLSLPSKMFINKIPMLNFDWIASIKISHDYINIANVMNIISNGKQCMGYAGDVLIATGYIILVKVILGTFDLSDDKQRVTAEIIFNDQFQKESKGLVSIENNYLDRYIQDSNLMISKGKIKYTRLERIKHNQRLQRHQDNLTYLNENKKLSYFYADNKHVTPSKHHDSETI